MSKNKKNTASNVEVKKTIKLFIAGEFPRTESGRSFPIYKHKSKEVYAQVCLASRKDLRNAVVAASEAQKSWFHRTAYLRGQILYRMAEMAEARREELMQALVLTLGYSKVNAEKSVNELISAFVYFAGFSDKYQQLLGAVNPVSGPHHNFTTAEPVGVVALIADEKFNLANFGAQIAAIVVSGNSVVALMSEEGSAMLAPLAEIFATSDLPKGVINLLTGSQEELYKHFSTHMEIQSLSYQGTDKKKLFEMKESASTNMKRVVAPVKEVQSLGHLSSYLEFKTVWHPVGL